MSSRINLFTVASIGIFAFGLEPVVHEVLGHAVVCWLTGGKIILISSTALQTASASRLVPAAGPLANILFGLAALALLRALITQRPNSPSRTYATAEPATELQSASNTTADTPVVSNITPDTPVASSTTRISLMRLFLYFFAFANLFLATGYMLYSGLIKFGDFAAVIDGLKPAWLYRATLVIAGALGYRYAIAQAARCLAAMLTRAIGQPAARASNAPALPSSTPLAPPPSALPLHSTPAHFAPAQSSPLPAPPLSLPAARRITHTACFAGGALFLLASFLNPIGPSLILYDGVSGTIGLTLGFFLALTDLRQSQRATPQSSATPQSFATTQQLSQTSYESASIPFNLPLTIAAAIFAAAFLIFMGKGIRLP